MAILSPVQAQDQKYTVSDTLVVKDQEIIQAPSATEGLVEQPPADDHTLSSIVEKPDTTLYMNSLIFPADSMQNWKTVRNLPMQKIPDSLLKQKTKNPSKIKAQII